MSRITTHVLDTSRGRPAAGVAVTLEARADTDAGDWRAVGSGRTDADGRLGSLTGGGEVLSEGVFRLTFEVGDYFAAEGVESFYPVAVVVFRVGDVSQHYHVPLLVSPFGYSTYRGS